MPRVQLAIAGLAFCGLLAACGQQQQAEPQPVAPQPTFDKFGNASCPDGFAVSSNAAGVVVCVPVERVPGTSRQPDGGRQPGTPSTPGTAPGQAGNQQQTQNTQQSRTGG